MNKLLIISGQTATGKTALGIQLAKKLNGEVVSFDSRQAYRFLNIITGKDIDKSKIKSKKLKVKKKNRKLITYIKNDIPIWLYDLIDPKECLNAYEFCKIAEVVIDDIISREKLPIIVGGSAFYIKVFLEGLGYEGVPPDWELRSRLDKLSVDALQKKLTIISKERLSRMNHSDRNNKRRLMRAIEIGASKEKQKSKTHNHFDVLFFALYADKHSLKENIQQRVKKRLDQGAIEEIKTLLRQRYSFDDPGLQTLGYTQLRGYFEDNASLESTVAHWVQAEVNYAKRQIVFLKKMKGVFFIPVEDKLLVEKIHSLVYKWII